MYGFGQGNCLWGLGTLRSHEDGWVAIDYSGIGHLLRMSKACVVTAVNRSRLISPKQTFIFPFRNVTKYLVYLFRVLATRWIVYKYIFFFIYNSSTWMRFCELINISLGLWNYYLTCMMHVATFIGALN